MSDTAQPARHVVCRVQFSTDSVAATLRSLRDLTEATRGVTEWLVAADPTAAPRQSLYQIEVSAQGPGVDRQYVEDMLTQHFKATTFLVLETLTDEAV